MSGIHPAKLSLETVVCPYLDIKLTYGVKLGSCVPAVESMRCKAGKVRKLTLAAKWVKADIRCDLHCVYMQKVEE